MSDYSTLHLDIDGSGIATITIDRQEQLNALDRKAIEELTTVVDEVNGDASIRGVIVTGAGKKSFVAGADINELATMTPVSGVELSRRGQVAFRKIELSGKVFVAAVNGFALGGGCELALACHLRFASSQARFGLPEVKLGVIPGYGGTVRLSRIVGKGRALEMILTGDMIDADEAYRIGLVNRVFAPEALLEGAQKILATIAANGPVAIGFALESATRGLETTIDDGLAIESTLFGLLAATDDFREGTKAFLEKRDARFEGK